MPPPDFTLEHDPHGSLVLVAADGTRHVGVVPVRAFPLTEPDAGLSLLGADGHELAWVDRLVDLPPPAHAVVVQELAQREFVPVIQRIRSVSTFATPSTWQVDTDRGPTELVLDAEENIRRLDGSALLIADAHGLLYQVRDRFGLDRGSRKLLERFL